MQRQFFAPYGDGNPLQRVRATTVDVFAPLRGWYCKVRKHHEPHGAFRPLAGISCNIRCSVSKPSIRGFRPLTGDGTAKWVDMTDASWFSPPYGDSTACLMCFMAGCCFSPPYGDGTMSNVTSMFSAEFSPPYGDGILVAGTYNVKMGFFAPFTGRTLSVTAYAVPAPPKGELIAG